MSGNKLFPGQHENEEIIFFFQKHWVELIYPVGRFLVEQFLIFMVLLFMYFRGQNLLHTLEGRIMTVVVIVSVMFTVFTLWIRLFNFFLRLIIITEYRLVDVKHQLFITNDENVIDFTSVQDVRAETHGFFNNIIKCGTLTFVFAGTNEPKVFHNVMHPHKISARIMQVREIHRQLSQSSLTPAFAPPVQTRPDLSRPVTPA